jgi:basic amino acid/polyamine antiporter, APA family
MAPVRQEPVIRSPHLRLWDTICIIVGIIIGIGIFQTPPGIFGRSDGPLQALSVWALGGFLCIVGGLCFAELAATYPRSGGEYVYLTRAFGPWAGFFFAWGQLLIVRTGASIVPLAYVTVEYGLKLASSVATVLGAELPPIGNAAYIALALLPIGLLTCINIIGVQAGKLAQNALTVVKVAGLGGVIVAGLVGGLSRDSEKDPVVYRGSVLAVGDNALALDLGTGAPRSFLVGPQTKVTFNDDKVATNADGTRDLQRMRGAGVSVKILTERAEPFRATAVLAHDRPRWALLCLSLIAVLWTYAGWHEGAYVAAEVVDARRNVPRALLTGAATVTGLYLLVNVAFVAGLGFEQAAGSRAVAADVLGNVLGPWGESAMSALVVLSALGGMNGMLVTNSRIFAEFGRDHQLFSVLGHWHPTLGTPIIGLLVQLAICTATVTLVTVFYGRNQAFEELIAGTAPAFWLFFLATGFALFVLRRKDPTIHRPFPTPGYPLTPVLYCVICAMMVVGSVWTSWGQGVEIWLGVLLLGLPLFWLTRRASRNRAAAAPPHFDSSPTHQMT